VRPGPDRAAPQLGKILTEEVPAHEVVRHLLFDDLITETALIVGDDVLVDGEREVLEVMLSFGGAIEIGRHLQEGKHREIGDRDSGTATDLEGLIVACSKPASVMRCPLGHST
jgi:hypothetical protein